MKPNKMHKIIMIALIIASSTIASSSYAGGSANFAETKYPIVLVHGFLLGFNTIAGVVEYWYQVPAALEKDGADVHVALVSATNSTEIRGEQLIPQIEDILAITGASKVNLIGHSQGATTARYVASVRPELVASVSSISGVNNGVEFADAIEAGNQNLIASMIPALADVISFLGGNENPNDTAASLASLTTTAMNAFNAAHPGGTIASTECGEGDYRYNGIKYYSWSGNSRLTLHQTTGLDLVDIVLGITGLEYHRKNDGLVASCTSHLGKVIRDDYYLNHLDATNGLLGLTSILGADPKELIVDQANRLKNDGL